MNNHISIYLSSVCLSRIVIIINLLAASSQHIEITQRLLYIYFWKTMTWIQPSIGPCHVAHNDVIMGTIASQITSLTIVYSNQRSKKTAKLRVTGLCAGNSPVTGEFPAQRASNAENVSIWWRHHDFLRMCYRLPMAGTEILYLVHAMFH